MKNIIIVLLAVVPYFVTSSFGSSIYDYEYKLKSTKKDDINLKQYKGKSILIVNIATRCGYTGQLDDLELLYKQYQSKGLVIIGIPSNDFGAQTPEKDKDVDKFCRLKYGVTFPLTSKLILTGEKKHPLAKLLTKKSNNKEISWNFEKFLFDRNGNFVSRFSSSISPSDNKLRRAIDKTLK